MANRYWIGGAGTWDSSTTTHWSASSGGAGGASVPGSSDTAWFDTNSGGGTVTPDYNLHVASIQAGSFASGTLDFSTNNNSPTIDGFFNIQGTETRTINLGSGTFTLGGNAGFFAITTTNLTFNAGTSTIKMNGSTYNDFGGGGLTYYNLWFSNNATTNRIQYSGDNTFNELKVDPGITLGFQDGTTQTVSSLDADGASGNLITLTGTSTGGWAISDSSGTNTVTYCDISYSSAEGGATWDALDGTSVDSGNNDGWSFPFIDRDINDQLNITEDIIMSNPNLGGIDVSDQLNITENLSETKILFISVNDQLNITEDQTISDPSLTMNVYDSLNISESTTGVKWNKVGGRRLSGKIGRSL